MRPEGCGPVRTWALLPVPSLLRSRLRKPARGQDAEGLEKGTEDKEASWRKREHDGAFPGEAKGMHHDTYMRMFWEHHEAEKEQLIGMREWLDKFEKKVG